MMTARERGAIVIIVAHRPSILSAVSHVMVMEDGRVQRLGTRDEILELMMGRAPAAAAPASPQAPSVTQAKAG
jgi:ABC-type protease/lipase transport system fused ATPase/permease subunit